MDDTDAFTFGARHRDVIAAKTERRHLHAGRAERTMWNLHAEYDNAPITDQVSA
jgi:hypothetical protein